VLVAVPASALIDTRGDAVTIKNKAPACDHHTRSGYRRRRVERHVIYFRATAYGVAIVRILVPAGSKILRFITAYPG
jgi:hypothetical protein